MGDEPTLELSAMRRLYQISARISARRGLPETLQAVVDGVVAGLGFGVAVANFRHADGTFEIVAVAGPQDARTALFGKRLLPDHFDQEFALADEWGLLRFVPHERLPETPFFGWVPDIDVQEGADAWHPLDALFAPLSSPGGELVGILSVDLPHDGRRPGRVQRELLELFALQAGIAIDTARLTERLRRDEEDLRAEQARLAASETVLRLAFDGSSGGMAIVSLEPHDLGRLVRVNEAMGALLGRTTEELLSGNVADVLAPESAAASTLMLHRAAAGEVGIHRSERRLRRRDGTVLWVALLATVVEAGPDGGPWLMVHLDDVTARKDAERHLKRQAGQDPLTGLANRRLFRQRLQSVLARPRDARRPGAVLFCDLDGFKAVNDTSGHLIGDSVLRSVAQRMLGEVRSRDTVARIGGDEFVVLAQDIGPGDIEGLHRRIVESVARPLAQTTSRLSISVGVAVLDESCGDVDDVLQRADAAMYAARSIPDLARRPDAEQARGA